jgi:hypothetical protein
MQHQFPTLDATSWMPLAPPLASHAEELRLLGVNYLRLKTPDGSDLYLTRFGIPFREQLHPDNWYAPDWFAARRTRLPGTSVIYNVPTRPVHGVSLDLVVRFSRVGEHVPLDTLTLGKYPHAEFNSPFEEFAQVMALRASSPGPSRPRLLTKKPLAIFVPPSVSDSGKPAARKAPSRQSGPGIPRSNSTSSGNTFCSTAGLTGRTRCRPRTASGCPGTAATPSLPTRPGEPSTI